MHTFLNTPAELLFCPYALVRYFVLPRRHGRRGLLMVLNDL